MKMPHVLGIDAGYRPARIQPGRQQISSVSRLPSPEMTD
jgi:hypothetical protein